MSIIEHVRAREREIDETLQFHISRNIWLESAEAIKTQIRMELNELSIDPIPYYVKELEQCDDLLHQFEGLL